VNKELTLKELKNLNNLQRRNKIISSEEGEKE